VTAYMTR